MEATMPTPLDILLDPATLAVLERLAPARPLPALRGCLPRAFVAMTLYFLLAAYLPLLLADALAPLQLLDLNTWPTALAAATDLLFGTFRNPAGYAPETGFWLGASALVADMLRGRDVSAPPPVLR
jgi:hypothetical protein